MSPPLTRLSAIAAPLMRDNINTDVIIPSREMKTVSRTGLADGLFADWRYTAVGGRDPDPQFVLNDRRYEGAAILLAGSNFGCGSSREHAAWALAEYGFRAVLAEGFNPIFRGNAILNGIAPVELSKPIIASIAAQVEADPQGARVTIDLDAMVITAPDGVVTAFVLEPEPRQMLREGLDAIALTQTRTDTIAAWREADRVARPWVYT